jgi:hypothetical protein
MRKSVSSKKTHPMTEAVEPCHLAFAMNIAIGVITAHTPTVNPQKSFELETEEGEVVEYKFTDNPFARVMFTVTKELNSLLPGDDDHSFRQRTAVMIRVNSLLASMRLPEIEDSIEQDSEGNFRLASSVIFAASESPLIKGKVKFKSKDFLSALKKYDELGSTGDFQVRLPRELIKDRQEATN